MYELFDNEWETIYTVRNPIELTRIIREARWKSDITDKIIEAGRRYNYAAIDSIMNIPFAEPNVRGWSTYVFYRLAGRDRTRTYLLEKYPDWREIIECDLLSRPNEFPELENYMSSITLMRR